MRHRSDDNNFFPPVPTLLETFSIACPLCKSIETHFFIPNMTPVVNKRLPRGLHTDWRPRDWWFPSTMKGPLMLCEWNCCRLSRKGVLPTFGCAHELLIWLTNFFDLQLCFIMGSTQNTPKLQYAGGSPLATLGGCNTLIGWEIEGETGARFRRGRLGRAFVDGICHAQSSGWDTKK